MRWRPKFFLPVGAEAEKYGGGDLKRCPQPISPRDVTSPTERHELLALRFSPDGSYIAAGCTDGTINVYLPDKGVEAYRIRTGSSAITSIRWKETKDPRWKNHLVATLSNGEVVQCHAPSNKVVWREQHEDEQLLSLDYSHDGSLFAVAGKLRTVYVYEDESKKVVHKMDSASYENHYDMGRQAHSNRIVALKFMPHSNDTMLSASLDGTIQIWDLPSGRAVRSLANVYPLRDAIDVSPDGLRLVSASYRNAKQLQVWDMHTLNCVCEIPVDAAPAESLTVPNRAGDSLSPTPTHSQVVHSGSSATVVQSESGRTTHTAASGVGGGGNHHPHQSTYLHCVRWSRHGDYIMVGGSNAHQARVYHNPAPLGSALAINKQQWTSVGCAQSPMQHPVHAVDFYDPRTETQRRLETEGRGEGEGRGMLCAFGSGSKLVIMSFEQARRSSIGETEGMMGQLALNGTHNSHTSNHSSPQRGNNTLDPLGMVTPGVVSPSALSPGGPRSPPLPPVSEPSDVEDIEGILSDAMSSPGNSPQRYRGAPWAEGLR